MAGHSSRAATRSAPTATRPGSFARAGSGPRGSGFVGTWPRLTAGHEAIDGLGSAAVDLTAHAVRRLRARPELGGCHRAFASDASRRHGDAGHVVAFARAAGVAPQV